MDKAIAVLVLGYMALAVIAHLLAPKLGIRIPGSEECPAEIKNYSCKRNKGRPCDHSPEAIAQAKKEMAAARREMAIKTGDEGYLE